MIKKLFHYFLATLLLINSFFQSFPLGYSALADYSIPSITDLTLQSMLIQPVNNDHIAHYRITYANSGADVNGQIIIRYQYSSYLTFSGVVTSIQSGVNFSHDNANRILIRSGISLSGGHIENIDIDFIGNYLTGSVLINNTGSITSDCSLCNVKRTITDRTNSVFMVQPDPVVIDPYDLGIQKAVSSSAVTSGDMITYTIFYNNNGNSRNDIVIEDVYPNTQLQYITGSTTPISEPVVTNLGNGTNKLKWTNLSLGTNSTGSFTLDFKVIANDPFIGGSGYTNTANIGIVDPILGITTMTGEITTGNNIAKAIVYLPPYDLILSKTYFTGTDVNPSPLTTPAGVTIASGGLITFRMVVTNSGYARNDIVLRDTLPAVEFIGFTGNLNYTSFGTSVQATNIVEWRGISLGANQTGYMDITFKLLCNQTISNVGVVGVDYIGYPYYVRSTRETTIANNTSTTSTYLSQTCPPGAWYDFSLSKYTTTSGPVIPGQSISYTLEYYYTGNRQVTRSDIYVDDVFSPGLIFSGVSYIQSGEKNFLDGQMRGWITQGRYTKMATRYALISMDSYNSSGSFCGTNTGNLLGLYRSLGFTAFANTYTPHYNVYVSQGYDKIKAHAMAIADALASSYDSYKDIYNREIVYDQVFNCHKSLYYDAYIAQGYLPVYAYAQSLLKAYQDASFVADRPTYVIANGIDLSASTDHGVIVNLIILDYYLLFSQNKISNTALGTKRQNMANVIRDVGYLASHQNRSTQQYRDVLFSGYYAEINKTPFRTYNDDTPTSLNLYDYGGMTPKIVREDSYRYPYSVNVNGVNNTLPFDITSFETQGVYDKTMTVAYKDFFNYTVNANQYGLIPYGTGGIDVMYDNSMTASSYPRIIIDDYTNPSLGVSVAGLSLDPGQTGKVILDFVVADDVISGQVLTNTGRVARVLPSGSCNITSTNNLLSCDFNEFSYLPETIPGANNTGVVSLVASVPQVIELSVAGSAGSGPYTSGDIVDYIINYCNNDTIMRSDISLRTHYISDLTYLGLLGAQPSVSFTHDIAIQQLRWDNITLLPAECKSITLQFQVGPQIVNTTTVPFTTTIGIITTGGLFTKGGDTLLSNNSTISSINLGIPYADTSLITITKSIVSNSVYLGDFVTYKLTYANPTALTGVMVLTDIYSTGLNFVSIQNDDPILPLASNNTENHILMRTGVEVGPYATGSVEVTFSLASGVQIYDVIDNQLTYDIYCNGICTCTQDINMSNNIYVTNDIISYDLAIQKTVNLLTGTNGTEATYIINYNNNGPDTITGVVVRDIFPKNHLLYISSSPTYTNLINNIPTNNNDIYDFAIGTLDPGQSGSISITTRVLDTIANNTIIINTGQIGIYSGGDIIRDGESNTGNNESVPSVIYTGTNVWINKSINQNTIASGEQVKWNLLYGNNGLESAYNVMIYDTFDPSLIYINSSPLATIINANQYSWNIGTLVPGQTGNIELITSLLAGSTGNLYQNIALITASGYNNYTGDDISWTGVIPVSSLNGIVYRDINASSGYDYVESGFNNILVQLLNTSGDIVQFTYTSSTGYYNFTGLLSGNYTVQYTTIPNNYTPYSSNIGDIGGISLTPTILGSISLPGGTISNNNNFGLVMLGSLAGIVYHDKDILTGYNISTDLGLPGRTVYLYNISGDLITTTVTNSSGAYLFTGLMIGNYRVEYRLQSPYLTFSATTGTTNGTPLGLTGLSNIAITYMMLDSVNNNFGVILPVPVVLPSSSGGGGGGNFSTSTPESTPSISETEPSKPETTQTPKSISIPRKVIKRSVNGEGYTLKLPSKLFNTGTPKSLLQKKGVTVIPNAKVETEMPSWIKPRNENTRSDSDKTVKWALARIPFTTSPSRFVVAIPSLGVVAPLQMAPKSSDTYLTLVNGGMINHLSYLDKGLFHYPGTVYPGGSGNSVIIGHSSDWKSNNNPFATLFASLPLLEKNQHIYIFDTRNNATIIYTVSASYETTPSDVSVLGNTKKKTSLTLFTCTPIGSTKKRWIVRATLSDKVLNQ